MTISRLEINFQANRVGATERIEHTVGILPGTRFGSRSVGVHHAEVIEEVIDITRESSTHTAKLERVACVHIELVTPRNTPRVGNVDVGIGSVVA